MNLENSKRIYENVNKLILTEYKKQKFTILDFKNVNSRKIKGANYLKKTDKIFLSNSEFKAFRKIFEYVFEDFDGIISNEDIWKTIYAFPDNSQDEFNIEKYYNDDLNILFDTDNFFPINANRKISEKFLQNLLNLASITRKKDANLRELAKKTRFIITGEVGTGKTSFFNYLFSNYHKTIVNDFNTFWVHIDYTKEQYSKLPIIDAIKSKTTKIFREFYFDQIKDENKNKYQLLKKTIRHHFNTRYGKNSKIFDKAFENFSAVFEKENNYQFHKTLQEAVLDYVEKEFNTIFIIDGLDNYHAPNVDEFQKRIIEVKEVFSSENRKGIFIFIMRDSSYDYLLSTYSTQYETLNFAKLPAKVKILRIYPAKFLSIINGRKKMMLKYWKNPIDIYQNLIFTQKIFQSKQEYEKSIKTSLFNLISSLNKFIAKESIEAYFYIFYLFIIRGILDRSLTYSDNHEKIAISGLKDLMGNNIRKLMNSIKDIHLTFLEVLHSFHNPLTDFESEFISNYNKRSYLKSNTIIHGSNDLIFQNSITNKILNKAYRILPGLLKGNYKHPNNYSFDFRKEDIIKNTNFRLNGGLMLNIFYPITPLNIPSFYPLLVKIRILQFLYMKNKRDEYVNENDLIESIFENFPYSEKIITLAYSELYEYGLISYVPHKTGNMTLELNRVGKHHLFILRNNIEYLRIILEDFPLPLNYIEKFEDKYFSSYLKRDIGTWSVGQIPRIVNLISLIRTYETWELQQFKCKNMPKKLLLISDSMIKAIIENVIRICTKNDPELLILKNAFENY